MAVQKSPGQKRKQIVIIFTVILFAVSTFFAGQFLGSITDSSLAWIDDHTATNAVVTELIYEEEEYRNRKGKLRTRDIYYLSYSFQIDGDTLENQVEVNLSQYNQLEQGSNVEIWYDNQDYYTNDTQENIEDLLADNTIEGNMFNVAIYTAPASMFIFWVLSLIFVRESKKALPKGFYTETSWLDVDDKYMVSLDGNELVYFNIDKSKISDIQEAYQNGANLEELMGNSKSSKLKRIPLAEISELTSRHNSDVINIEHNEENHSIEFLNQTVKAHALERITKHIPTSLAYTKKEKTRIQAAIPSLLWLLILITAVYFVENLVVNAVIGLYVIVSVLPKIIGRLLDPTVIQTWETLQVDDKTEPATE